LVKQTQGILGDNVNTQHELDNTQGENSLDITQRPWHSCVKECDTGNYQTQGILGDNVNTQHELDNTQGENSLDNTQRPWHSCVKECDIGRLGSY
jgi:hypothetical protein